MLITHNALEFLFTPGRVTILGESDGNRLRRIYTDGRPHPDDPDPTFHGHSVGHWEGETLVVDTVGIVPQSYLAITEAAGVPNNGDIHVIEHIHLQGTDFLHDDLEIIAPKILTRPWKTKRNSFANASANTISSRATACRKASSTASTRTGTRPSSRCRTIPAATWCPRNKPTERHMSKIVNSLSLCILLAAYGAGVPTAAAHHSTAMFDSSKNVVLTGTVVELRWTNPHVHVVLNGTTKAGEPPAEWLRDHQPDKSPAHRRVGAHGAQARRPRARRIFSAARGRLQGRAVEDAHADRYRPGAHHRLPRPRAGRGVNPVDYGLVASLNRPGGNLTA